jgi:hypothetical protein
MGMLKLRRLARLVFTVAGAVGALVFGWALFDPTILPAAIEAGAFAPPSPRWRAAFGLVFSLAVFGFGIGALRHRELP